MLNKKEIGEVLGWVVGIVYSVVLIGNLNGLIKPLLCLGIIIIALPPIRTFAKKRRDFSIPAWGTTALISVLASLVMFLPNPPEPVVQKPAIQEALQAQSIVPVVKPSNSEDELNHCFGTGKSAATVAIANFKSLSENNISADMVRTEACKRVASSATEAESCIYNCELGFNAVLRDINDILK